MALAHVQGHVEFLAQLGFFVRVDAGDEGMAAGVEVQVNFRAHRLDDTLAAAGIGPDHPSLYPAGRPGSGEAAP